MPPPRRRLDAELVRRGLVPSRTLAHEAIATNRVTVDGVVASKPSRLVSAGQAVVVARPRGRYVSRGGEKLEAALRTFDVSVEGRRALDAGASTGGFTDCLLQHGAGEVVAADVGYGQLHERIRRDARVEVRERCNVRHLSRADLGQPVDLVVADLSFISLRAVLPALLGVCRPGADLVLLVKPQFEAGREDVAKGRGVIRDPEVRRRVRGEIEVALRDAGAAIMGWMESPLTGAEGNVELFVHARAPGDGT